MNVYRYIYRYYKQGKPPKPRRRKNVHNIKNKKKQELRRRRSKKDKEYLFIQKVEIIQGLGIELPESTKKLIRPLVQFAC